MPLITPLKSCVVGHGAGGTFRDVDPGTWETPRWPEKDTMLWGLSQVNTLKPPTRPSLLDAF